MPCCLDTNVIVSCLRGQSARLMNRLRSLPVHELRVPMQVLAELYVGAEKSARPAVNRQAVEAFVKPFAVLWPDELVVDHYVSIRCSLEAAGRCISEADLWIAATARSQGDVIVTNVPDHLLPLAFGADPASAGSVTKVPKAW